MILDFLFKNKKKRKTYTHTKAFLKKQKKEKESKRIAKLKRDWAKYKAKEQRNLFK